MGRNFCNTATICNVINFWNQSNWIYYQGKHVNMVSSFVSWIDNDSIRILFLEHFNKKLYNRENCSFLTSFTGIFFNWWGPILRRDDLGCKNVWRTYCYFRGGICKFGEKTSRLGVIIRKRVAFLSFLMLTQTSIILIISYRILRGI